MRGADEECGCYAPGQDPHACAVMSAEEDVEEAIENCDLCDCECHWPDVSR